MHTNNPRLLRSEPVRYEGANRDEAYFALPERIRVIIRNAPYDFAAAGISELVDRLGEEAVAEGLRQAFEVWVKRATLELYGPTHPQAG